MSPYGPNRTIVHDDVIECKHFPRYWPFVRGIHRLPVNSPHKGQWRGALMFSLICAWINDLVNNREAGDLRRHRAHCDVIVMESRRSGVTPSRWKQNQRRWIKPSFAFSLPFRLSIFPAWTHRCIVGDCNLFCTQPYEIQFWKGLLVMISMEGYVAANGTQFKVQV